MLKIKDYVDVEYLFKIKPSGVWVDTVERTIGVLADHFGGIDIEAFNFIYDLIKADLVEKID